MATSVIDSALRSESAWRDWLAGHTAELADARPDLTDTLDERIHRGARLLRQLTDEGLAGYGWPVAAGGLGGTAVHRAVFYDGLVAAGLVLPESVAALEVVGSALVRYAPELARKHLPELLSGRELWCQGFSETEAGSDLASLRTRAVRAASGGLWLSGHKIWTSLGHRATHCAVLARTSDEPRKHRGLSLLWVDLTAAGVTVRPLDAITGEPEFSEIYFDDVELDDSAVIGELGQGWAIAMYMLQFERGMWAWQRQALMHAALQHAVDTAQKLDPHQSRLLVNAYACLSALRSRCLRTVSALAADKTLGPEVSVDKLLLGQTEHLVQDAVRALSAPSFVAGDDPEDRHRRSEWFYSRAATVYGGAAEVQKNIVAERLLGLPRSA